MVANNTKGDFMAGSYACDGDDGKAVKLNKLLGSKILGSNLLIAVMNRTLHSTPGRLTQEVSQFYNKRHIKTSMI